MKTTLHYTTLNQQLKQAGVGVSATELHAFISALVCGGVAEQDWLNLVYQFTNDGQAYSSELLNETKLMHQQISQQLKDFENFAFSPFFPEQENVFARAEELGDWVNNFLLGLGLAQPKIAEQKGDIGEAVEDLQDICQLSYDEEEDQELLAQALEELIEYVRTISYLFYNHSHQEQTANPTLH